MFFIIQTHIAHTKFAQLGLRAAPATCEQQHVAVSVEDASGRSAKDRRHRLVTLVCVQAANHANPRLYGSARCNFVEPDNSE